MNTAFVMNRPLAFRIAMVLFGVVLAAFLAYKLVAKPILIWAYDPTRNSSPGRVIVLSADWCPNCRQLKTLLQNSRIPYVEEDVEKSWSGRWAYRAVRAEGVPVTIVESKVVYGFNRKKLPELQAVFAAAGYKFDMPQPGAGAGLSAGSK